MTSYRQIEANRRNALKSTGPKSEEGKQASRCNALRHGLTAETVIGSLEDAEDCTDHAPNYRENRQLLLDSRDVIHTVLRRADSDRNVKADNTVEYARCFLRLANLPNFALDRLSRYEATLWRRVGRTLFALDALDRRKPQERIRNCYVGGPQSPWCEQHGMPVMAYSPLGGPGASLLRDPTLAQIGATRGCSAAAVALAWNIRSGNVIAIPESGLAAHVKENAVALTLTLTPQELQTLDAAYPPPH